MSAFYVNKQCSRSAVSRSTPSVSDSGARSIRVRWMAPSNDQSTQRRPTFVSSAIPICSVAQAISTDAGDMHSRIILAAMLGAGLFPTTWYIQSWQESRKVYTKAGEAAKPVATSVATPVAKPASSSQESEIITLRREIVFALFALAMLSLNSEFSFFDHEA